MHSNGNGTNGSNGNGVAFNGHGGTMVLSDILPHSEDAELALLGSLLIDPDSFYEVDAVIQPADFYSKERGAVYQAIVDLKRQQQPVDVLTLGNALAVKGIEKVNGIEADVFTIGLLSIVPTAINIGGYARIIEAMALRRRLIWAGDKIRNDALKGETAVDELIGASERALFEVTQKAATRNVITVRQGVSRLLDATMQMFGSDQTPGIHTGLIDLDRIINGLRGGRFYVVAGRPGMGKSILESNIAVTASRSGRRVARFNLEMSTESVLQRAVSDMARIPYKKIEDNKLTQADLPVFNKGAGQLSELPMWIDDTPGLTLSQLSAKARRIQAEHGLDLITIDYLTLMSVENSYGNRTQDVGQISRGLKRLSKELDVPVLAVAQLSRQCEQRSDKRPMLSDLRDSGEIEQDADMVIFLYRDEYYNPDTTQYPNQAEAIIAKHRHGKTGMARLRFDGDYMRFTNLQAVWP